MKISKVELDKNYIVNNSTNNSTFLQKDTIGKCVEFSIIKGFKRYW